MNTTQNRNVPAFTIAGGREQHKRRSKYPHLIEAYLRLKLGKDNERLSRKRVLLNKKREEAIQLIKAQLEKLHAHEAPIT